MIDQVYYVLPTVPPYRIAEMARAQNAYPNLRFQLVDSSNVGKDFLDDLEREQCRSILILGGYRSRPFRHLISTAKRLQIPTFLRTDSSLAHETQGLGRYSWPLKRLVFRSVAQRLTGVIPTGETNARLWANVGVADRLTAAWPQGIDFERFSLPSERNQEGTRRFLLVARLIRRKRIDLVVRAFNEYPHLDMTLEIVGDGPERQRLRSLAGSDARIGFRGALTPDFVAAAMHRADFLLHPAGAGEPFGLVLVEAACAKLPVIVDPLAGAVPEVAEEGANAMFVPNPSPLAWGAAIRAAATMPAKDLATMSDNASCIGSRYAQSANPTLWISKTVPGARHG